MHDKTISAQTYVVVCALLVVLTFLTVGFSFTHVPGLWHVVVGLLIALCKASLVVLFFMHAILSPRLVWTVIAVVCFWVGILFVLTLTDYLSRGLVPGMPGH
ncbi:MAG TPA: cytochrome C oxidase subunit IV family protein [Gemmataceae bacterium]|nr:cytochrome C oxidase subunit IV family protein [Gemmataceae bacterium]